MLARANRVVRPSDFRTIVRAGRRIGAPHLVVYVLERGAGGPGRFGFIVGKNVGGAVQRNLVRRRLRECGRAAIRSTSLSADVVVRALPGSADVSWATLHGEVAGAIDRSEARA